jgi:8-oxo-dGTP pyrophosphatase MutT (NUDIX family)
VRRLVSRATLVQHADALVPYLRDRLSRVSAVALPPDAASAREAAVLAPLYVRDGLPCLLFTLRSLDLPKHRGEISFPGGSRDADDASLEWTALREAHEELGLDPQRVEVLGPLPTVYAAVSNFVIQPYVGWLGEGLPSLAPNPAEVAEVIEAPLAALAEPEIYHSELWRRAGIEHLIHFYDFGAYRIWGATGRMLYSLLELLPAEAAA